MAEVVHDAQQEFWRPPSALDAVAGTTTPLLSSQDLARDLPGLRQRVHDRSALLPHLWTKPAGALKSGYDPRDGGLRHLWRMGQECGVGRGRNGRCGSAWHQIEFPGWLYYLHFHEIKRRVGLPTAALVAFMIGLGCVAGALGVSFFYRASNLAEFQAIQMWRIEWLLAATASFVAGILLKKPSNDRD